MKVETYRGKYDDEIISLILGVQNSEAKINLSFQEQPDLIDISRFYQQDGGELWIALSDKKVVGTIELMFKENQCAILKKFLVHGDFRLKRVGLSLYNALLKCAKEIDIQHTILDTSSVATASHRFHERAGFRIISTEELPIPYTYPDRDSIFYISGL